MIVRIMKLSVKYVNATLVKPNAESRAKLSSSSIGIKLII